MTNFMLMYDFKMNPNEWDQFVPFEKQIYLDLLAKRLEEKNKKNKNGIGDMPMKEEFE